MANKYFDMKDTVYHVTEKYNEAKDLLISLGFTTIEDESKRKNIGKEINLETALKSKKINPETFEERLLDLIENNMEEDVSSGIKENEEKADIKILGILPCPVKNPLLEALNKWYENKEDNTVIDYELKPASMGVDWLKEDIQKGKTSDDLPDIFMSAGFDLFFDKELMGKFKKQHFFEDYSGYTEYNKDFNNNYINLKDPDNEYSMLGVVPAVFLINKEELGHRDMPQSWKDILNGDFENSVSLPIGDFDLFNAILLNIYKNYGEEGVKKLGKTLKKSMHPSEMVKSHAKRIGKPVVTIMPFFFTKLAKRNSPMTPVWPEDGAIISPIFMLTKKDKKEKVKPIVDFLASKEVGEILSHNGKFPSVNPNVDNRIPSENKYMWLGWNYINNNDIGILIKKCEDIFNESVKEFIK